jgi:HSP20 family protein
MLPVLRRNWFGPTLDEPVARLRGEVDTLFDRFFGGDGGSLAPAWAGGVPVAMWEDDDRIHIEAELPGVADTDVDVTVHNGLLFIRAERRPAEGRNYLYNGRAYGRFERVITLPEAVDTEDVQARLADGLLSIELTKSPEAKPKKITVQTS